MADLAWSIDMAWSLDKSILKNTKVRALSTDVIFSNGVGSLWLGQNFNKASYTLAILLHHMPTGKKCFEEIAKNCYFIRCV
jgi:hypothetical protein